MSAPSEVMIRAYALTVTSSLISTSEYSGKCRIGHQSLGGQQSPRPQRVNARRLGTVGAVSIGDASEQVELTFVERGSQVFIEPAPKPATAHGRGSGTHNPLLRGARVNAVNRDWAKSSGCGRCGRTADCSFGLCDRDAEKPS